MLYTASDAVDSNQIDIVVGALVLVMTKKNLLGPFMPGTGWLSTSVGLNFLGTASSCTTNSATKLVGVSGTSNHLELHDYLVKGFRTVQDYIC